MKIFCNKPNLANGNKPYEVTISQALQIAMNSCDETGVLEMLEQNVNVLSGNFAVLVEMLFNKGIVTNEDLCLLLPTYLFDIIK